MYQTHRRRGNRLGQDLTLATSRNGVVQASEGESLITAQQALLSDHVRSSEIPVFSTAPGMMEVPSEPRPDCPPPQIIYRDRIVEKRVEVPTPGPTQYIYVDRAVPGGMTTGPYTPPSGGFADQPPNIMTSYSDAYYGPVPGASSGPSDTEEFVVAAVEQPRKFPWWLLAVAGGAAWWFSQERKKR